MSLVKRTSSYTTFTAVDWSFGESCLIAKYRLSGLLTLEHATYNWPWVKTSPLSQTPACLRVWPCALFIVIANAGRTGNCLRCHSKGYSSTCNKSNVEKKIIKKYVYLRNKCYSWDKNNTIRLNHPALKEFVCYTLIKDDPCPITQTLVWTNVS